MRIHDILIVPAAGYSSPSGAYTLGKAFGNLTEMDLVDKYVHALTDELDDAGIRWRSLPVRKPPGVPEDKRHEGIFSNTLVLHCCLGWMTKCSKVNKSKLYFSKGSHHELPDLFSEAMAHWGQIYVSHGHQGGKPTIDEADPLLRIPESIGIRVEPFMLNGPELDLYVVQLQRLGRDLGRTLSDYMIHKSSSVRARPSITVR